MSFAVKGTIHGKSVELTQETGLPDGQEVAVEIQPINPNKTTIDPHAELSPADVAAVREYAKLPLEMRCLFGAWADDAEELDKYLEWNRQQKKVYRKEIND